MCDRTSVCKILWNVECSVESSQQKPGGVVSCSARIISCACSEKYGVEKMRRTHDDHLACGADLAPDRTCWTCLPTCCVVTAARSMNVLWLFSGLLPPPHCDPSLRTRWAHRVAAPKVFFSGRPRSPCFPEAAEGLHISSSSGTPLSHVVIVRVVNKP